MKSEAVTPEEYIASLQPERQVVIQKLRQVIRGNIDPKFQEEMSHGMLGYVVPKSVYPAGYHANPKLPVPFLNLANQKNYIALYHMGIYANPNLLAWFRSEYEKTGFKLDMGKSCIRFKKMDQIPYNLIAKVVKKFHFTIISTDTRPALIDDCNVIWYRLIFSNC